MPTRKGQSAFCFVLTLCNLIDPKGIIHTQVYGAARFEWTVTDSGARHDGRSFLR
jgi:hypothetical protein